jgi:hypothetical protein
MELIRQLLLKLESMETRRGGIYHFPLSDDEPDEDLDLPGYTAHEIEYHARLLINAGIIDAGSGGVMEGFLFRGLTWEGHDFIDAIRDDAIWEKTKKGATEVGGLTFELLKDLAKGFIKKQIADKTGISI